MSPFAITALFVVGTFIATMTFDMGINALQNWYEVVYQDAFWSQHPSADSPAMQAIAREEQEINRLMLEPNFVASKERK